MLLGEKQNTLIHGRNRTRLGKQSIQTNIAVKFTLATKYYNITCNKRADNKLHLFLTARIRLTCKQLKRFVCMNFVKNVHILSMLIHVTDNL